MKKTLYLSLVTMMLANVDVQNAYGAKETYPGISVQSQSFEDTLQALRKSYEQHQPPLNAGMEVHESGLPALSWQELDWMRSQKAKLDASFWLESKLQEREISKLVEESKLATSLDQAVTPLTNSEIRRFFDVMKWLKKVGEKHLSDLGTYCFLDKEILRNVYATSLPEQRTILIGLLERAMGANEEIWKVVDNIASGDPQRSVLIEDCSESDAALLGVLMFNRASPNLWELLTFQQSVLNTLAQAMQLRESLSPTVSPIFRKLPMVTTSLRLTADDIYEEAISILSIVNELILDDGITRGLYNFIADNLKGNKSIKRLVVEGKPEDFAPVLEQLTNLEAISFSDNNMKATDIEYLVPILKQHPNLTEIDFSDSEIGDDGVKALAPVLKQLPKLTKLILSGCKITEDGAKVLTEVLPQLSNLMELDLSGNSMGDEGIKILSLAFKQLTKLTQLNLSSNGIRRAGATAIADVLPELKKLVELNLSRNVIGLNEARALHKAWEESKSLITMKLLQTTEKGADVIYNITYDKKAEHRNSCVLVDAIPNTSSENHDFETTNSMMDDSEME